MEVKGIQAVSLSLGDAKLIQGPVGPVGPQGVPGPGLEYNWDNTKLGVRVEGETQYTYSDLKGDKGDKGDQGEPGADGVAMIIDGYYSFSVNDAGRLILSYTSDIPPDFTIKDDGHLYVRM